MSLAHKRLVSALFDVRCQCVFCLRRRSEVQWQTHMYARLCCGDTISSLFLGTVIWGRLRKNVMLLFSPLSAFCHCFNDIWKHINQITRAPARVCVLQPWGRNALKMSVCLGKKLDFFFLSQCWSRHKRGRRDAQELNEHWLSAVCENAVLLMCALKCISRLSCLQGLSLWRICWQKEFWYRLFLRAVFWRTTPLSPGTAATLPVCLSFLPINSADAQQSSPHPHIRCRR